MTYQDKKELARREAIDWQQGLTYQDLSYSELAEDYNHFRKLGKRYGLLKEFKENGIL